MYELMMWTLISLYIIDWKKHIYTFSVSWSRSFSANWILGTSVKSSAASPSFIWYMMSPERIQTLRNGVIVTSLFYEMDADLSATYINYVLWFYVNLWSVAILSCKRTSTTPFYIPQRSRLMKEVFFMGNDVPLCSVLPVFCFRQCPHAYGREMAAFSWAGLTIFSKMRDIWVISPPSGQPSAPDTTNNCPNNSRNKQLLADWARSSCWKGYLGAIQRINESLCRNRRGWLIAWKHLHCGLRFPWAPSYQSNIRKLEHQPRLGATLGKPFLICKNPAGPTKCSYGYEVVTVKIFFLKRSRFLIHWRQLELLILVMEKRIFSPAE